MKSKKKIFFFYLYSFACMISYSEWIYSFYSQVEFLFWNFILLFIAESTIDE